MKPIEPGCLALILRGNMANHVCTVIGEIPVGQPFITHDGWALESEREARFSCRAWEVETASHPEIIWTVAENNLMRIDGHEPVTNEEEREVTV